MSVSLKPAQLKRHQDIAVLFIKFGRSDVVKSAGVGDGLENEEAIAGVEPKAEELAADLEKMGPAFIKLGRNFPAEARFCPLHTSKRWSGSRTT